MNVSIATTTSDSSCADPICTDGMERLRVRIHPSDRRDPPTLIFLPAYVTYAQFRHSSSPISIQGARDFVTRRNPLDKEAILHRLR